MEDQNATGGQPQVGSDALFAFLRGKLAQAEQALRCREEMAERKPMTDEQWEEFAKMPGVRVTKGRRISKAALKELAEQPLRHKRIAEKCRHEVAMFTAVIAALEANEKLTQDARP